MRQDWQAYGEGRRAGGGEQRRKGQGSRQGDGGLWMEKGRMPKAKWAHLRGGEVWLHHLTSIDTLRKRENERETDRETDRETERQRER